MQSGAAAAARNATAVAEAAPEKARAADTTPSYLLSHRALTEDAIFGGFLLKEREEAAEKRAAAVGVTAGQRVVDTEARTILACGATDKDLKDT